MDCNYSDCFCMSGDKYNNCCGITGYWDCFQKQKYDYFNEKYVLQDLLEKDDMFQRFYNDERKKIIKPVFFLRSKDISAKMSYGNINHQVYVIISKYDKIPISESIHIAHELAHLVLCSEGHKNLEFINSNSISRKHKMLNDMIYDPLLNKKLKEYGYNIINYLNFSDKFQKKTMMDNKNPENIFLAMVLYVKRTLDWRNLNPDISSKDIKFNQWIQGKYPQVIHKSNEILKIIDSIGFDTPSKSELVLNTIVKCLKLTDELELNFI